MFHALATKLYVSGTTFSEAVEMFGANAVRLEGMMISQVGGGEAQIVVQEGNDLMNWSDTACVIDLDHFGNVVATASGIASRFVRLKYAKTLGTGLTVEATLSTERV